jgi:hypothetical protein
MTYRFNVGLPDRFNDIYPDSARGLNLTTGFFLSHQT